MGSRSGEGHEERVAAVFVARHGIPDETQVQVCLPKFMVNFIVEPCTFRQAGQTSVGDVKKRDLRTDLLLAEHEAKNKKRKADDAASPGGGGDKSSPESEAPAKKAKRTGSPQVGL